MTREFRLIHLDASADQTVLTPNRFRKDRLNLAKDGPVAKTANAEDPAKRVKLQIPVPRYLQRELESLGRTADRSVSFITELVLDVAIEEHKSVLCWIANRTIWLVSWPFRPSNWPQKDDHETVRIQTVVSAELADKLEALGAQYGHSPVKMACLLLDATMDSEYWIAAAAVGPLGKAVGYLIGKEIRPDHNFDPLNESADVAAVFVKSDYRAKRLDHARTTGRGAA